jgi:hypothetical protein
LAFLEMGRLLQLCVLEELVEKAVGPCTRMAFVGVLHNTDTLTLEVTLERLCEIRCLFSPGCVKRNVLLKNCHHCWASFTLCLHAFARGVFVCVGCLIFLRTFKDNSGCVWIPEEIKKDMLWWSIFLPEYNGVSMMALEEWTEPDSVFACDACLHGCDGMFGECVFHALFPEFIRQLSLDINCLELLTICVCVKLWAADLRGKRIVVRSDNFASVCVLNSGESRCLFLQSCLREICYWAAVFEFEIKGVHIEGDRNVSPDLLSRWDLQPRARLEFHELTRGRACEEVTVAESLFQFSHAW